MASWVEDEGAVATVPDEVDGPGPWCEVKSLFVSVVTVLTFVLGAGLVSTFLTSALGTGLVSTVEEVDRVDRVRPVEEVAPEAVEEEAPEATKVEAPDAVEVEAPEAVEVEAPEELEASDEAPGNE